ncbi:hypothetical protein K0M31_013973, partial [Melipona bicolor]
MHSRTTEQVIEPRFTTGTTGVSRVKGDLSNNRSWRTKGEPSGRGKKGADIA